MELITGGTGIVGSHLLLERVSAGEDVRALVRPGANKAVVERVFRHYRPDGDRLFQRIQWVEGDVLDTPSLETAMEGVGVVYHAAALVSFDDRDTKTMQRVNVVGTANVVNTALLLGVPRLCHISSTATIGAAPASVPRNEELPWTDGPTNSPYAISKWEAELEVQRGVAEGLHAVMVNPCVILGPGPSGRSSMTLVERLRKGTSFHPPGSNAVVDARDVAAWATFLLEHGSPGERYLLVGENLSYKALFEKLAHGFGHSAPSRSLAPWVLELAWRVERVRSLFGGRPFVTRHSVRSALTRRSYSAAKALSLGGPAFRSADEAVANVVRFLK